MASGALIRGLREQIVARLRSEILSGRLGEGTPLREMELARRFGVSRGPIREALQELVHEGLLVAEPHRGVRVAARAPDFIRDLVVPIRRTVETFALRLFFDQITEEDFRRWEEILERLRDACQKQDYPAIAELDIALHRSIVERAGQPDLLALWSVLLARIHHHFRQTQQNYADPMDIYREHRALIDTFRRGNVDEAADALADNIE